MAGGRANGAVPRLQAGAGGDRRTMGGGITGDIFKLQVSISTAKSGIVLGLLRRLNVDRAVAYLLVTRLWQIVSYLVLAILIAHYFTAEQQGYYFTFLSLLSLQIFVELGLTVVIINAASHEWSLLGVDASLRISGDPRALSRLVGMGRLFFKWYGMAMLLFIVGVGIAGYLFFHGRPGPRVDWLRPWVALVLLAGLNLWLTPLNAVLEGCNQIVRINRAKLHQAVMESLAVWMGLVFGAGLWCLVFALAVRLARNACLLFVEYRNFFIPFLDRPRVPGIDWFAEVWPLQWRLAIQGAVGYFFSSLFTPVMFHYHGPVVAGQTGMTLQMANGLQIIGMAWITTRVPTFGGLIAKRQYDELDALWRRATVISVTVVFMGAIMLSAAIIGLNAMNSGFARRLLDPFSASFYLLAAVILQFMQSIAMYLRAHKREPIMVASVTASLATGLLVWILGKRWGPAGAGAGYLCVLIIAAFWLWRIMKRCRREWHTI